MRIDTHLTEASAPVLSLEFFTPKTESGRESLSKVLGRLKAIGPGFVSITCGAAGTTRERTADLAVSVQREFEITTMAHVVCTGTTVTELRETLAWMQQEGIENILALRGDPPRDQKDWEPVKDGLRFANELTHLIKSEFDFSVGGACYPEKHHDADTPEIDLVNLKKKVDAGAGFLITQLFFDNDVYWRFVERAQKIGIEVPILPGIMPVLSLANLERIAALSPGSSIPSALYDAIKRMRDDDSALEMGVEWASKQVEDLLEQGAPGVHFYTLNKSKSTLDVCENLGLLQV